MQYWWVSHNKTFEYEFSDGFLWSPKTKSNGQNNKFYSNMCEVNIDDIIFSFAKSHIQAVGTATSTAFEKEKPKEFKESDNNWDSNGWQLNVKFEKLPHKILPKDHCSEIKATLPDKYSPLNKQNCNGLQGVYLTCVPENMAQVLIEIMGQEYSNIVKMLRNSSGL